MMKQVYRLIGKETVEPIRREGSCPRSGTSLPLRRVGGGVLDAPFPRIVVALRATGRLVPAFRRGMSLPYGVRAELLQANSKKNTK